jgi:anti-sigma factor RsiW
MKSKHITKILDETTFANLSAPQRAEINAHASECDKCRKAFQSAELASVLLKNRAVETFEPTPFFETRVLAALREKQIIANPVAAFWRWWQASSAVVFLMLFSVGVLLALTFLAPQRTIDSQESATIFGDFPTERVIFRQDELRGEITNGQALQIIYEQDSR